MPGTVGTAAISVAAAGVGLAAGFLAGRQRGMVIAGAGEVRRLAGSNLRWMNPTEVAVASALLATGQKHLLTAWPRAGVRDAAKRKLLATAALGLSGGSTADLEEQRLEVLVPPVAAQIPKQLTAHGDTRVDEFYWIRDDARKSSKVLSHIKAENAYTQAVLADTTQLQEQLYTEMRSRIKEADESVPARYDGYYYYSRTLEGQQYKIHCRRAVPSGAPPPSEADVMDLSQPEEVLLDENKRKEEGKHTFYAVGAGEPSPNHKLYAFSEDTVGGEKYTLHVKDLSTGHTLSEPIPKTSGDVEWAADNKTLFYVLMDHLDRPYKVVRHVIGQPVSSDVVVYEEKDESFYVGIHKSKSEQVIFISSGSAITSETRYLLADRPTDELKVVLPRQQDMEYNVSHRGAYFYITIRDASRPNSELRVAPISDPTNQQVLIEHSREVKIESVSVSQDYLAVFTRSQALQRASVYRLPDGDAPPPGPLDTSSGLEVAFEEPAYSLGGGISGEFSSPVLRLGYSSLTTPESIIDFNMSNGKRATKKIAPVLGGFDQSRYVTQRLWATAPDGVSVPISLVYRKDAVKLDGTDPLLLNGYGSYEISNDPYFSMNRLSLLNRGFVYAMAHIRGGGEMGRYWYEDGKFLKKVNTFTDFIAAAEHLIAHKFTSPSKLCIEGRSAGGLLMGAVINMRPDLFNACILGVPFVDVLTTIQDETIPLTIIEWEEWGNPTNKEYYDYIKSYSPVDNVKPAVDYPHILATGGLHDPRVAYWEPAKFVAKLRKLRPVDSKKMLLLKTDMGAGHFSVTGRFERLKEVAFEYAFLLKAQGMLNAQPLAS